jgi:hypothetical protein
MTSLILTRLYRPPRNDIGAVEALPERAINLPDRIVFLQDHRAALYYRTP